jgi:hypothetical protein
MTVRQCAWCLRLMDDAGERISPLPVPKNYEASHGICKLCGSHWLETICGTDGTAVITQAEDGSLHIECTDETLLSSLPPLQENEGQTLLMV